MVDIRRRSTPGRPGDLERRRAFAQVTRLEQEVDEPGVVVAVKMSEGDRPDRARIDAEALHREQPGRAAVDQQPRRLSGEEEAGVEAAAAAQGIAAAENVKLESRHGSRSRAFPLATRRPTARTTP